MTRAEATVQAKWNAIGLPPSAIVVMGVSGCGKTTLSNDLAAYLGCPAFEGDDFHAPASVAKMRAGRPLDDGDRWPWLDRLGAAIGTAVRDHRLAVAACSALKRSYRERLEQAAGVPLLFVLLDGTREEIAAHLAGRKSHYMPPSLLDSQFATLERPGADERATILHCYAPIEVLRGEVVAWAQSGILQTAR
ncbi:MAG: gluconokinase [Sphingomonas sp.]